MRVKVLNVETQSEVREFSLEDSTARTGECLIGRSPDLGLVLESSDVSRLHGKFVNQSGQYTYYDLGSANGSLVNGKLATANQPYPLKPNDIVRIGEFTLMLREVQPLPEDLPMTVMSSADATVVGSSWQFPGFSAISTEESAPSVPDVPPEPVLVADLSEEFVDSIPEDAVAEDAVEPPAIAETDEISPVSEINSTLPAEAIEAAVDSGLLAALAAISGTTENTAPDESEDESEDEITDHSVTAWETPSLSTEQSAIESITIDPPTITEPALIVPAESEDASRFVASSNVESIAELITEPAEPTSEFVSSAIANDATFIQPADLLELDNDAESTDAVSSEPITEIPELIDFADDATVIQPADLLEPIAEVTVGQPMSESPDAEIAAPSVPVSEFVSELASEPTVIQAAEAIAAVPEFASEPDATVFQGTIFQGTIAESPEQLPVESAPAFFVQNDLSQDDLSQDDSIALDVPQLMAEPAIEPVTDSVIEPAAEPIADESAAESVTDESITEPVTDESVVEAVHKPITEPVSESITEPITEPVIKFVAELIILPVAEPVAGIPVPFETADSDSIAEDSKAPVTVEPPLPQPFSDRYVALLCHDNQLTEMTQFVERHKSFLSQCLTISTPSLSQALADVGLQITRQTPAVPMGGYQTVNSLITSDKVLAIIFLRDFFSPQPTQANDEALTRSCNVYQVLLANNLPTAEAIAHYLENVLTGSVAL